MSPSSEIYLSSGVYSKNFMMDIFSKKEIMNFTAKKKLAVSSQ